MDTLNKILKLGLISQEDYDCVRQLQSRRHEIDTRLHISGSNPIESLEFSIKIEINTYRCDMSELLRSGFSPIDILRDFNNFNLDKIEKELVMPQGYLSKAIKNKLALPKEWEATLKKYLLNLAKNINEKMA